MVFVDIIKFLWLLLRVLMIIIFFKAYFEYKHYGYSPSNEQISAPKNKIADNHR